jgi:transcription initiation factor TFIID subunit 10
MSKSHGGELNEFLLSLDSYNPTIPENLTKHYLERSGLDVKDPRITKLISLATDKLLSEILYESRQVATLRQQGAGNKGNRKRKFGDENGDLLDLDDIQVSLAQLRVFLRRKSGTKKL